MSENIDIADIEKAVGIVKSGIPVVEKLASLIMRFLPSKEAAKIDPLTDELLAAVDTIPKLQKSQRILTQQIEALIDHYNLAIITRTECDKSYELAINIGGNPTEVFWTTQKQMLSDWDDSEADLIRAIEADYFPFVSEKMRKHLKENAELFKQKMLRVNGCFDNPSPSLKEYVAHIKEMRKASVNIQQEIGREIKHLIRSLRHEQI